jgi:hypothetical protein
MAKRLSRLSGNSRASLLTSLRGLAGFRIGLDKWILAGLRSEAMVCNQLLRIPDSDFERNICRVRQYTGLAHKSFEGKNPPMSKMHVICSQPQEA